MQRFDDGCVQLINTGLRRVGRRIDAAPALRFGDFQAKLDRRWHGRQFRRALRAEGGQDTDFAGGFQLQHFPKCSGWRRGFARRSGRS